MNIAAHIVLFNRNAICQILYRVWIARKSKYVGTFINFTFILCNEGSAYGGRGGVTPGSVYRYTWNITEDSGPDTGRGCVSYLYHSDVDLVRDINSGLVGFILVCLSKYDLFLFKVNIVYFLLMFQLIYVMSLFLNYHKLFVKQLYFNSFNLLT